MKYEGKIKLEEMIYCILNELCSLYVNTLKSHSSNMWICITVAAIMFLREFGLYKVKIMII